MELLVGFTIGVCLFAMAALTVLIAMVIIDK